MTSQLALRRLELLRDRALVDGEWIASAATFNVFNPATGSVVGQAPKLGAVETRAAIAAAHRSGKAWAARTAADRAGVLRRWFDLVISHQDDLAAILTAEQGKPLSEACGEIVYAANFIEWFAEEAKRAYGDVIPPYAADRRVLAIKQPVGVVGAITPWNFPAAMITRKVAPALAAGCTVVLKPASATPLTAFALCFLATEAGVPAGVLNCVTGGAREIAGELTASPLVRKLSFTGSTEIGRELMAACAPSIKKLSLELGGNAPFIVFDDADLDAAVEGAVTSKFRNAGQTCICTNRFYVQVGVYELFLARLASAVSGLVVGDGASGAPHMGPLIDEEAVRNADALVDEALADGARLVLAPRTAPGGGSYAMPTVVADVSPRMRLAREEIFAPVAAVAAFTTEAEVLALANASEVGLAGYVYTSDPARIVRMSEGLECGMVGVNTGLISTETAPFGGIKQSGLGREGSRYGLDEYLELKYVCLGGLA